MYGMINKIYRNYNINVYGGWKYGMENEFGIWN